MKILIIGADGQLGTDLCKVIPKKEQIPFILFVSTREVGSNNYITWDQIRELKKEDFLEIGNHSHTHEYLVDEGYDVIKNNLIKFSSQNCYI